MNADELLEQARQEEEKRALESLKQTSDGPLAPELFWTCDHQHEFGEGLYRDPGRCPQCLSHLIRAVYPVRK